MFSNSLFNHVSANAMPNLIKLKNKAEVPKSVVNTTMKNLKMLLAKNPETFYELVQKCRNPSHKMFGRTLEVAQKMDLISSDGIIHSFIKDIILSAVSGYGFDMIFGSPEAIVSIENNQATSKFGIKSKF